ncbi:MAG: amidohydrolase family protein [Bacteriovorax sp.]|nr:amidohydrolase family protein [Bacteriovorax sp.]
MSIKSIQATCATSKGVSRQEILFDSESGLIKNVGECKLPRDKVDFFYDHNFLLFAGMGDIHIHAREDISGKNNYKEDFNSVCCAALNGGLVHVADMPNNPVPPIDDESYLSKVILASKGQLPILMYAGIGPTTRPLSFTVPYKAYMGPSIGDLYFKSNSELENVLKHYRHQWVSFHCEDPEILEQNKNKSDHFKQRPLEAELMATDFALALIEKYELKGKLCHYSAGAGLDAIRAARKKGVDVTCEVTPQHLFFSEEGIRAMKPSEQVLFQMNPPIRELSDSKKLLEALRNNEIDYLATDHAPHSPEEKAKGMSGLPGLDTYAAFVTWLLIDQGIAAETVARVTAENPGRFFNQFLEGLNEKTGLYKRWGKGMGFLEPDFSASFTVINLHKAHTVTTANIKTKARWSPFLNITFPGSLEAVFIGGNIIPKV